ncbi:MAG: TonB-dependent receptor domain-containing protein, partial [Vicinamibacteraceae bacterium]
MAHCVRRPLTLPACLLAGFLCAPPALAQQQLAAVQGTTTDETGAVLPGVSVAVTNMNTGIARTVVSNNAGVYRVASLDPGRYRVAAELAGFSTSVREDVTLQVGATVGIAFVLKPGAVTENVEVVGVTADIQTEKADVSAVVEQKKVSDLPLVGRNPLSLAALQPGMTGIPGRADFLEPEQSIGGNASGLSSGANSATVDGMSINGAPHAGTVLLVPNVEAVQEFRVTTNNPSAERGRNAGASIDIITKGGTNTLRGSVFEFHRNETLRAKGIFEDEKPDFERNTFGASLGGPIRRDRTFFFFSYEGVRELTASGALYTVETQQFRDFVVQTRPNSIAADLLQRYAPPEYPTSGLLDLGSPAPGANEIGPPDGIPDVGAITAALPDRREGDQFNGRFDWMFRGGNSRLRTTYYLSNISTPFTYVRSDFDHPYPYRNQLLTVGHTHIFSDQTLNELSFGYVRMHGSTDDPTPQVPTVEIDELSGSAGFGVDNWHPIAFTQNYFQMKDTLTMNRGTHSVRVGGEWTITRQYQDFHHYERPSYSFSSILDFADDEPFSETRAVDPATGLSTTRENLYLMKEFSLFVQDNWKIGRNLTANLGLRYENFGSPTLAERPFNNVVLGEGATRQAQMAGARAAAVDHLYETDWNNLAPRLGLSWDVTGDATTVLRGGGGVSYNRINNTVWTAESANPPYYAQATNTIFDTAPILYTTGPDYPENPALGAGVDENGGIRDARVTLTVLDPEVITPYAYNWFVGVQRAFPWGLVAEGNYIGSAGRDLIVRQNYNRFAGDLLDGQLDRLNPSFGDIDLAESRGSSRYHGLALQVSRRYGDGFAVQGAYTLGKVTDTVGSAVDVRRADLENGPADFDVRHRLAVNAIWELPVRSEQVFVQQVLGGWQLNTIAIWQTGTP